MKKLIIGLVVVVLAGAGIYFFMRGSSNNVDLTTGNGKPTPTVQASGTPSVTPKAGETVIGKSVEGRDITGYQFGTGETKILFVGGIHGGYEWNTALVAFQMMDYLKANPAVIPANVQVTVIPVLNPDGLNKVVSRLYVGTAGRFAAVDVSSSTDRQIAGRYNAHKVDLNRNFDCDWQANGKWQTTTVSGGSAAFSEPESLAMKNYIEAQKPAAVVVWYSAVGGVFSSNCHDGVLSETKKLTDIYAKASGYPAHASFNFYEITGDMVNWLAKIKIPAISVLLTNHTDTEAGKNQAGIKALLQNYAK